MYLVSSIQVKQLVPLSTRDEMDSSHAHKGGGGGGRGFWTTKLYFALLKTQNQQLVFTILRNLQSICQSWITEQFFVIQKPQKWPVMESPPLPSKNEIIIMVPFQSFCSQVLTLL